MKIFVRMLSRRGKRSHSAILANSAVGMDIARSSLKTGYEFQMVFWGSLDAMQSHRVKLGVAYTF